MIRKSLIIVFMLLSSFAVEAQKENPEISTQKREQSLKLVFAVCPNADILEIESKEDYLEVEYLCNGDYYEMGIRDENVLYIETKGNVNTVPYDKIRKKLEKDHADWLLDEVSQIVTGDTSFLKVEVVKDGLEQNLFFTTDGKWYKSTPLVVSDLWTLDDLEKSGIYKESHYNLTRPDQVHELPALLREISGHTLTDSNTVLCVQDELGVVFEFDLARSAIRNMIRFTDVGDFEGITTKGSTVYVLRSDGTIFTFDYKNRGKIQTDILAVNALNFESLTYDKFGGNFYAVSKDAELNTPESIRNVYQFSKGGFGSPIAYATIDVHELSSHIKEILGDKMPDGVVFNPSDIAVHPISQYLYVLAADDRMLAVYNRGVLQAVYPLPSEVFYKPEGIAFLDNGDMLISSEGDKKGIIPGSIMVFEYLD